MSRSYNNYRVLFKLQCLPQLYPVILTLHDALHETLLPPTLLPSPDNHHWMLLTQLELTWGSPRVLTFLLKSSATDSKIWTGSINELSLHHDKKLTKIKPNDKLTLLLKVEPTSTEQEHVFIRLQGKLQAYDPEFRENTCLIYQIGSFKKKWELNPGFAHFKIADQLIVGGLGGYGAGPQMIRVQRNDKNMGMASITSKQTRLKNPFVNMIVFRQLLKVICLPHVLKQSLQFPELVICIDMGVSNGELGEGYSLHDGLYQKTLVNLLSFIYEIKASVKIYAFGVHNQSFVGPWSPDSIKEVLNIYSEIKLKEMASRCELVPLFSKLFWEEYNKIVLVLTDGDILDICKAHSEHQEQSVIFVGIGEGRLSLVESLCDSTRWHMQRVRSGEPDSHAQTRFLNTYFRLAQKFAQRRNKIKQAHSDIFNMQ